MQDIPNNIPNNGNTAGNKRIAMLIDGDNAQASLIEKMVAETSKYGLVTIRHVYGDWTTTQMKSWKDVLSTHAIQPIQQFQNTVGKNSTDSALIIDAMDILYEGAVNGFCLVSSDSDYTRLATRIREKGVFVMGIGKNTTPRAFVNACEIFVFTQNLSPEKETRKAVPVSASASASASASSSPEPGGIDVPFDPLPLLKSAFDISVQEDGWAFLGTVGGHLHRLDPSFDLRTYGYKQLIQLIKAYQDSFEIRVDKSRHGPSLIYIRRRDENPA